MSQTDECTGLNLGKQKVAEVDPHKELMMIDPAEDIDPNKECIDSGKQEVTEMNLTEEAVEINLTEECIGSSEQEVTGVDSKEQIYPTTEPYGDTDSAEKCAESGKELTGMGQPKEHPAVDCVDPHEQEFTKIDSLKEQIDHETYPAIDIYLFKECKDSGQEEFTEVDAPREQTDPETGSAIETSLSKECTNSYIHDLTEMDTPKEQIDTETGPGIRIDLSKECTYLDSEELTEMDPTKEQAGPCDKCPDSDKHGLTVKPQMNISKPEEITSFVTKIEVHTAPAWNCSDCDRNASYQIVVNESCTSKLCVDVSGDNVMPDASINTDSQETQREGSDQTSQEIIGDIQSVYKEHQPSSDDNSFTSKILVPYTHDQAQVWDPEVVMKLWNEHRIVGQLVGALPRKPHQNGVLGLPLNLMKEEVRLMKEQNIGLSVIYKDMEQEASKEIKLEFEEQRRKCFEEQIEEAKAQRKREIEMMADRILAGKRKKFEAKKRKREEGMEPEATKEIKFKFEEQQRKCSEVQIKEGKAQGKRKIEIMVNRSLDGKRKECEEKKRVREEEARNKQSEKDICSEECSFKRNLLNEVKPEEESFTLTKENVIEEEMAKIRTLPEDMQVIEVFTQNPLINRLKADPYILSNTDDMRLCTKSAVYRDLWLRGYYVTQGLKFGGDFLVYPGDPHLYHACFIVRCVEDPNNVSNRDLVAATRLAAATKKTFVLATLKQECASEDVCYRSYQWAEED